LLQEARTCLADYLNVDPLSIVYFTNPTTAANMAARSLDLQPGDEILATDQEYGAMDRTGFMASKRALPGIIHCDTAGASQNTLAGCYPHRVFSAITSPTVDLPGEETAAGQKGRIVTLSTERCARCWLD
jgi:hypothetical protein